MNNSRLFRLSRIVIALTAASGMMVNTAHATDEAKAATQLKRGKLFDTVLDFF